MTATLDRLGEIVRSGLCHRCGSCAGICPGGVIGPDDDYYPAWPAESPSCTDCGLCLRVCPGREFSFPDHARALFGRPLGLEEDHGFIRRAFLGYAADPELRAQSTSGGVATALPLFFLGRGKIGGALTVRSDARRAWRPEAFVARTPEEVKSGMLSKYPACSMNHLLGGAAEDRGPWHYTGLPCQIHGLRRMAELKRGIEGRISLIVGLICHSVLDHQALRDVAACYALRDEDASRLIYRYGKLPGYVRLVTRDGRMLPLPYPHGGVNGYRPNAKEFLTFFFKFYSPLRCRMCIDATSEFSDLSIGDPWIRGWQAVPRLKQGYNIILVRTARGLEALEEARAGGAIVLEDLPEETARMSQVPMIPLKRRRAFWNMDRRRRHGLAIPVYGLEKSFTARESLKARFHTAMYLAADRPRLRTPLVRFLLSRTGRFLVGLVFVRRHLIEPAWERVKSRITGRTVVGR